MPGFKSINQGATPATKSQILPRARPTTSDPADMVGFVQKLRDEIQEHDSINLPSGITTGNRVAANILANGVPDPLAMVGQGWTADQREFVYRAHKAGWSHGKIGACLGRSAQASRLGLHKNRKAFEEEEEAVSSASTSRDSMSAEAPEPPVPGTVDPPVPGTVDPPVPASAGPSVPASAGPSVPASAGPSVPANVETPMPANIGPPVPANVETPVPATAEPPVPAAVQPPVATAAADPPVSQSTWPSSQQSLPTTDELRAGSSPGRFGGFRPIQEIPLTLEPATKATAADEAAIRNRRELEGAENLLFFCYQPALEVMEIV